MAVRVRLMKMGSRNRPFYRIVVANAESPRDGRHLEMVGYYNPLTDPPEVKVKEDRVLYWLHQGAQPTQIVKEILKKEGVWEKFLQQKADKSS